MNPSTIVRALGPVACCALSAASASASTLNGSTLQYNYYYPNLATVYAQPSYLSGTNVTVTGAVEMPSVASAFSADLTNSQLIVTMSKAGGWDAVAFNGFAFDDLTNNLAPIISVTVNPATTYPGITNAQVIWNADRFGVNWRATSFSQGDVLILDIVTGVPTPGTAGLFGLCAVVAATRRRR